MLATAPSVAPHSVFFDGKLPFHAVQQPLQVDPLPAPVIGGQVNPLEHQLATQLAHLASQHHASEYNRVKFGPKGSPVSYVPLTLQSPDHVKDLQLRQAVQAENKAWWPSTPRQAAPPLSRQSSSSSEDSDVINISSLNGQDLPTLIPQAVDLQQAISSAMSTSISSNTATKTSTKTSFSHPINISAIVPFDTLSLMSHHMVRASSVSPFMFYMPPCYYLDCIVAAGLNSQLIASTQRQEARAVAVANQFTLPHYSLQNLPSFFIDPPSTAGSSKNQSFGSPTILTSSLSYGSPSETSASSSMTAVPPMPVLTSNHRIPISASSSDIPTSQQKRVNRLRLRNERALSAPPTVSLERPTLYKPYNTEAQHANIFNVFNTQSSLRLTGHHPNSNSAPRLSAHLQLGSGRTRQNGFKSILDSGRQTPSSPSPILSRHATPPPQRAALGNLLLSSCPGKKVRLTGPVKGRGAICRDLRQDLSRVKELGVGCVICCLDDDELSFLGANWSEYSQIADDLGLDVLRLPTPEGLAPLTPEALDAHLTSIITSYTLQGIPILVHCRGGVGRAGLVACCWVLKLGLCGWKNQLLCRTGDSGRICITGAGPDSATVCRATLNLVERVISVVRNRRSLKAVETYEQVKFLVDFVEYLDSRTRERQLAVEVD